MDEPIGVLIAIQARSNSTRFPKKIFEYIGDHRMLEHVVIASQSAARHVMLFPKERNLRCHVAILHPHDDRELTNTFRNPDRMLFGGSENDVLSRYVEAQKITGADYVVRLTSDCPMMLDFVVGKHINVAAFNRCDYVTNTWPTIRTFADGYDCEVMSAKALKWLDENAKTPEHREHVTTLFKDLVMNNPLPNWRHNRDVDGDGLYSARATMRELLLGTIQSKIDTSDLKMSVDTPEDLEHVRRLHHAREYKMKEAQRLFGKAVHKL